MFGPTSSRVNAARIRALKFLLRSFLLRTDRIPAARTKSQVQRPEDTALAVQPAELDRSLLELLERHHFLSGSNGLTVTNTVNS